MQTYTLNLTKGGEAIIFNKRELRLRSRRILFFKIRRSKKYIAYSIVIGNSQYTIFKSKEQGSWADFATQFGETMKMMEQKKLDEIKDAIDRYENQLGASAYLQLF